MYDILAIMDVRFYFTMGLFGTIVSIFKGISSGAPITCDAESSQVSIRFLFVSPKQWTNALKGQLRISIANSVNSFCEENATDCGLKMPSFFTTSSVNIVSGYPKADNIHSVVAVYVELPERERQNKNCAFIRKSILKGIINKNKTQLHLDLTGAAGRNIANDWVWRISHIDGIRVLPSGISVSNSVGVATICAITILLAIIVLVLEFRSRMQRQKVVERSIEQTNAAKLSPGSKDGSFAIVD